MCGFMKARDTRPYMVLRSLPTNWMFKPARSQKSKNLGQSKIFEAEFKPKFDLHTAPHSTSNSVLEATSVTARETVFEDAFQSRQNLLEC